VQHERRPVDVMVSIDDVARMVEQDQIARLDDASAETEPAAA